jgi:hypothetical protein
MNAPININLISTISEQLREMLGDDFDAETFWDTLDGETDAGEIMDRVLSSMNADSALADAAKSQADELAARSKRIRERATAKKSTLKLILDATGERKAERPAATVSLMKGRVSVQITDDQSIPSQLCKVVTSPDKTAIKKQLEAGEEVPGAELVRGDDTVSVRVK